MEVLSQVKYQTPEAAEQDNLKPLNQTSVLKLYPSKNKNHKNNNNKYLFLEFGSSASKTIFGGFIKEEPLSVETPPNTNASNTVLFENHIVERMQQRQRGTILASNLISTANSTSSMFFLLLRDFGGHPDAEEEQELAEYRGDFAHLTPVGFVEEQALRQLLEGLDAKEKQMGKMVHPLTNTPIHKINIVQCGVNFDYHTYYHHQSNTNNTTNSTVNVNLKERKREEIKRIGGKVRRRDEDDEEAQNDGTNG
ncbi:hypothetical protein STCU_11450 [Strigomonas culicis]|uniref:Uncharacterized protein n=1 Tax=Strigomonas culicis TaxID=28005 RepID=S9TDZ1_9TRYP|nr:hypothetical protein STCU_11450 [Strigomonas culicis]|eukprot:EPY16252.1 hypothetical protein STCU_11450 [Strigomonas culicis]